MINRLIQVAQSIYREHQKNKRSPEWASLRKWWIFNHPTCEVCQGRLLLQVHHIVPFHDDSSLELNKTNLITLCAINLCHLRVGHSGDFKHYNTKLLSLINEFRSGSITRQVLEDQSKQASDFQ